jgi:translation initiation factor IF-1
MLSIMCTDEFVVTNRFSDQTKKVNYVWLRMGSAAVVIGDHPYSWPAYVSK